MKTLRLSLAFVTACGLLSNALLTAQGTSATAQDARDGSTAAFAALTRAHRAPVSPPGAGKLSPLTLRELARARRATAKYHDIANAEADGYVNGNFHTPGEGHHWINPLLVDDHFDPAQPEVLLYASRPDQNGLTLVAVEYLSPDTFPVPEGFTGDDDVWQLEEPFPLWVLNAWIWRHNPNGVFTFLNPRVP
jgi:hypothetical protein